MASAIGALDCTHVKILKPGGRQGHGDEYINRKGVNSVKSVQSHGEIFAKKNV